MMREQHLRVEPGSSFAALTHAQRPRIAGTSEAEITPALRGCFDPATRWLSRDVPLVFDADACSLDGQPLTTQADFQRVIDSERLAQVDGAFVLAWRTPAGGIALARDPIGQRTLYYTRRANHLLFASSLLGLRRTIGATLSLDLRSVAAYLSYAYVPGASTLVEGIFELLPGEIVSFERGALSSRSYWHLPQEPTTGFPDEQTLRGALRASLETEITRLLPTGAALAASLSGGIDSSLVVALAQRLHAPGVHTFSISFGRDYANELEFSSLVARHCGTQHTIVELTPAAVLAHLDDTMALLGKPNGDPLTVPNALLFRTMAAHASVALNGEGGDPCFGGPKNLPMLLAELYADVDGGEAAYVRERSYLRAHLKCFDDLADLLTPEAYEAACTPPLERDLSLWFEDARFVGLVSRLMAINVRFKGGHHILPKIDALSAPFGVAPRSPLFSKAVVEAAMGIPAKLKLHGSVEKYLLKRAVEDLLPQRIVERPKSGMMVPVEAWFQGPLLSEARARILDGLAPYTWLKRAQLEALVAGRGGGLRPRRGVKLWLLIALESHLRALHAA
jgi:asparagine synthase (glutamine-hydrolysing)